MECEKNAVKEPEITVLTGKLGEELARLEKSLEALSDRLEPVLSQNIPPSTTGNDREGTDTSLGETLANMVERVETSEGRIQRLINRLEV